MSHRFGTMGSLRGDNTRVISPDDEIVCTCHGENHADMASRIAELLDQDSEADFGLTQSTALRVLLVPVLLITVLIVLTVIAAIAGDH